MKEQSLNSLQEKNEEFDSVKNSMIDEWVKKELIAKLQYDTVIGLKDQLNKENEHLKKENEKMIMVSEDLVKTQDLLMVKLNKKTVKLEKYDQIFDAKANYPNKSIQCNIEIPNNVNIHSANLNIPNAINNISTIQLPNQSELT